MQRSRHDALLDKYPGELSAGKPNVSPLRALYMPTAFTLNDRTNWCVIDSDRVQKVGFQQIAPNKRCGAGCMIYVSAKFADHIYTIETGTFNRKNNKTLTIS